MRQRRVKNRDRIIEECGQFMLSDCKSLKGKWSEVYSDGKPLYLEVGSGKGQFIAGMAKAHPEADFLACEGGYNIYIRIIQKIAEEEIPNLMLIPEYIIEPNDFFEPGELDGVYINFCDPWPKHPHRRLTCRNKLLQYKGICKQGGFLQFKTDNDDLFDFSLEEIKEAGLTVETMTRDLWNSELAEKNIPTEYETKFATAGKSINYVLIRF